jgi:hypothetical protein
VVAGAWVFPDDVVVLLPEQPATNAAVIPAATMPELMRLVYFRFAVIGPRRYRSCRSGACTHDAGYPFGVGSGGG